MQAYTIPPIGRCAVQVAAFQMLTGWPQEDLLDPLSGVPAAGGFLFDRLQDYIRVNDGPQVNMLDMIIVVK